MLEDLGDVNIDKFEEINNDWAIPLMEKGVIVKLTINLCKTQAKLDYHELGISFDDTDYADFVKKYVVLGSEKLLPPETISSLQKIMSEAREILAVHSFKTIWGNFVPYTSFMTWYELNEQKKEEFNILSLQIIDKYDEMIEELRRQYYLMAREAWKRNYDSESEPNADFSDTFVNNIIAKVPTRESMFNTFKYSTCLLSIPLPSFVEDDLQKTKDLIREGEIKDVEQHAIIMAKQKIAEEYKNKKVELVESFLDSTVRHFRHHIKEMINETYQVLSKKTDKDIAYKKIEKLRKTINKIELLNFFNDEEVNNILVELNLQLNKYNERDTIAIVDGLKKLVDLDKDEDTFNKIIDFD